MADRGLRDECIRMIRSSLNEPKSTEPPVSCASKDAPDIARYVSGEMSVAEQVEAERHMSECTICLRNVGRTASNIRRSKEKTQTDRLYERTRSLLDRLDDESNRISMETKARYRSEIDVSVGEPVPEVPVDEERPKSGKMAGGKADSTIRKKE